MRIIAAIASISLFSAPLWAESPASKVDFNYDIRPILSQKCYHCHGPDEGSRKAKLRFDIREEALKERDGTRAIIPGNIKESETIIRIHSKDEDEMMPPPGEGEKLTATEIELLTKWIEQGAEYKEHWAWSKPSLPSIPQAPEGAVVRNPIDAFITAMLPRKGLQQAPEADRYTLIRRLSLDLIGLPPTPEEVATFVNDQSPDFYEKAVDRLLASPHYGERWASMWMDLARYADSSGYGSDMMRLNIWPYRDWLIKTFNANQPYDQFTIEQIAGDLLPNATEQQISATAFHRNTLTNMEGGTNDEEYRVAAIKDRIATTCQVFMGLTMQCAQCHTHKFDPITAKDYYSFYAIFNQTEDSDKADESPKLPVVTEYINGLRAAYTADVQQIEKKLHTPTPELQKERDDWEVAALRKVEWQSLKPTEVVAMSDTTLSVQNDDSVLASGAEAQTDLYTVKVRGDFQGATAVRLEVMPDATLPKSGPGRASNGNFVLDEARVTLTPKDKPVVRARKLKVQILNRDEFLNLAEVEIFSGGKNVALKGKATQISTEFEGVPERAIDGNINGRAEDKSISHTSRTHQPWWEVDLGADFPIDSFAIWNRTHEHGGRLQGYRVTLHNEAGEQVWSQDYSGPPKHVQEVYPRGDTLLELRNPTADFSQATREPGTAMDGNYLTGWAILPQTGQSHAIVFELAKPIEQAGESELVFALRQSYGAAHTIGKFRLFITRAQLPIYEMPANVRAILAREPTEREPHHKEELQAYFRSVSKIIAGIQDELNKARKRLNDLRNIELPIMRELPAEKRRETFVLNKGNYLAPGEKVEPALPASFAASMKDHSNDRMAAARWLVHPDNPLTSRVIVNRFWSQLFGTGFVETQEDFGTQGALPSHPELLDWLAVKFQSPKSSEDSSTLGWDMKALLKLMVTSATYRQAAAFTPERLEKDPRNRLLSFFPRRRLEAEAVRDQALALSGLMSRKLGGPSVYPPQPDGMWKVAFNGGQNTYPTSTGEDRYRRALYTILRRTMPYPSLNTFDAPSRESCTLRRRPTNTPLQAFVTLNDPCYVEAAQALARRIITEGGADNTARVKFALNLVLGRPGTDQQINSVRTSLEQQLAGFRTDTESASKLATHPLGALPAGMDAVDAAAWTVIANILLNLDAVLTKS